MTLSTPAAGCLASVSAVVVTLSTPPAGGQTGVLVVGRLSAAPPGLQIAQAGVAAGALVLTGVFVLATIGVDLGFNGRRQTSSPQVQPLGLCGATGL